MTLDSESIFTKLGPILDALDEGIVILDSAGKSIEQNRRAAEWEIASDPLQQDRWRRFFQEFPPPKSMVVSLMTPFGKRRFEIRSEKIPDGYGGQPLTMYFFKDNTDSRFLQVRLKRLEFLNLRSRAKIRNLEMQDPLTGLFNRSYTSNIFSSELSRAKRTESRIGVIAIDIDRLKVINDTFGTGQGDELIANVGKILLQNSRKTDIAARTGGEEFLLILPGADRQTVLERAERIRDQYSLLRLQSPKGSIQSTLSVGVAMFPADGSSEDSLMRSANSALYVAKRSGKNRVVSTGSKD
ncbi:GGDEF domain-containing protein [Leptospira fletcheri]|uniref:diguanylate cyclase n=1 Tax=Leptospira fletcheri TaxID=2484981 RepID=A0A4R9GIY8_9LEPT|nr:GGDEF domain-containing protein [Leptospira fletcheri]TGK12116.1 GGDEF domain-containing protein [Leptospira fletcheri]